MSCKECCSPHLYSRDRPPGGLWEIFQNTTVKTSPSLEIVTLAVWLDRLVNSAGKANPCIEIAVLHEISVVQQSTDSAHHAQCMYSVEL